MKIVVFGLTVSSSWGNGHATLWRGLVGALARRGHEVVFYERDVPYYARHRDLATLPDGELVLYRDWDEVLPGARRHLAGATVAMVTSYCPDGMAATDLVLDTGVPVRAFYDLDTPVTLARLAAGEEVSYLGARGLGEFDLVLSYTGGRALDELQIRLGARRVVPLYGSVDPDRYRPVAGTERFRADLSYLGTYAQDRQSALLRLLVEPARRLSDQRFLIGGALYPADFPWAPNIFSNPHVAPPEHPEFFSSSRFTLNVTRGAMAAMGYCPSGRLFEAAACGTAILSDVWEGLDRFFTPGEEILVVGDADEVIGALLADDGERLRLGRRARERTLDEHTAGVRAREFEAAIEAVFSTPSAGATNGSRAAGAGEPRFREAV